MSNEIERKFLVKDNSFKNGIQGVLFKQGYLSVNPEKTVRIRVFKNKGFITIKGITKGISRVEYEYEIPYEDALLMLDGLCEKPIIEKHRYFVEYSGKTWEIDEFHGDNFGLTIAEIEILSEDEEIELPPWIDKEVTGNKKYYNSNLVKNPYTKWNF